MRALSQLLLGLVLIFIVAWAALWWYAEGRIEDGISNWATKTAAGGQVQVSYDQMTRGTSPLAATVFVKNMRIVVTSAQVPAPITFTIPVVTFSIAAATPTILNIDAGNQASVAATKGDVVVSYANADVIEHLNAQALFNKAIYPITGSEFKTTNLNVLASSGSLQILHIDNIDAQGAYDPTAGAGQTAFNGSELFQGITVAPLVTRLAGLPFNGQIAEFAVTLTATGPVPPSWHGLQDQLKAIPPTDVAGRRKLLITALHDWAAGGGAAVSTAKIVLGPSTLNTTANVKFDANVQPIAGGDARADHVDAFTQDIANAYPQLQPQIAQFEAVMSPYLSTDPVDGQVLAMHITAAQGHVDINGKTIAPLPPLDWNSLENPPPPPVSGVVPGQ
jgi:hypothetical protein